ncbi:helix-turn-helix transcriptional regulator [Halopelagius longus]|uniref:MarR family transcriptional regulator n=1 Tax=Halopelagius longus TaxID=1236180 RepID=A0A1H1FNQ9_9EURY|nr:MarR family transcriptional regulator [Halopelagius longus]RDI70007.1 MarR family transcriptional regulator [Halopelagius longus]SDR02551.1 Predicted transcriptional regulator, contains HTH domain [Halopelagius longus]
MSDTEADAAVERIALLARSTARATLLVELMRRRELRRRELAECVDVSRTTLQRNLDTLAAAGWVRRSGRTYRITTAGDAVARSFEEFREVVEITERLSPFLRFVPREEFGADVRCLADADLLCADPPDPYAVRNRHVRALKEMDECRMAVPFTGLHAQETLRDRIVGHGARAELVVEPEVAETLRTKSRYASLYDEMAATGRYRVYVHEGPVRYGVALIDDTAQFVAHEEYEPRALVETDDDDAVSWAAAAFAEYKREATPLT